MSPMVTQTSSSLSDSLSFERKNKIALFIKVNECPTLSQLTEIV